EVLREPATGRVGFAEPRAVPGRPAEQRRSGRLATAEEQPGPHLLEHPGGRPGTGGLREERVAQVVPGDLGHDRVDPLVVAGRHQGEPAAVRTADYGHPRITGRVGADLRSGGQPVDQALGVAYLPVRAVQVDL